MKKFISLSFLILLYFNSTASHLMGGGISYEYLGEVSPGVFRYQVTIKNFINCGDDSNIPDPAASITLLIYNHDKNNPDADKILHSSETLFLTSVDTLTPNLPDSCVLGTDICIKEALYIKTIDLPVTFDGYHLFFQDYARNAGIINLLSPDFYGMGFHAFIPPSLVSNNSPTFNVPLIPYICFADTTTILNSATDPDGDQLIFSFAKPYDGGSNSDQPPVLPWPIDTVPFANGYSKNEPFGSGGSAYINAATGFSEYYIPFQGQYVIVVEIKEYRNGQLIGITRRDLQLLVIDCPANPEPDLNENPDSSAVITEYNLVEGEDFCFDVTFSDSNDDSLYLSASGSVFDTSIVNPAATLPDAEGDSTVTSQFCWNTVCNQEGTYNFDVTVRDNGCPPKEGKRVFTINILPFQGPDTIFGPVEVCAFDTAINYSVTDTANSTFEWIIIGGTQTSGDSTGTITVNWGSTGSGQVRVIETSQYGCVAADTTVLDVYKNPLPPVSVYASPDTICAFDATTLYAQNAQSYTWRFLSNPDSIIGTADSLFIYLDTTTAFLLSGTDTNSCTNYDTVIAYVNSLPPVSAQALPDTTCAGDTAILIASGANLYWWAVASAPNDTFAVGDTIGVRLDTTTNFILTGTDTNGCINTDTVQIFVHPLPVTNPITGSPYVCPGVSSVKYWVQNASPNSTFEWIAQQGTVAGGQGTDTVTVNWSSNVGPARVSAIETDSNGCVGDTVHYDLQIIVQYIPPAPSGNDTLCDRDKLNQIYEATANTSGSVYTWGIIGGNILNGNGTYQVTVDWDTLGANAGAIWFVESSNTSDTVCVYPSDTLWVTINPNPATSAISGEFSICAFDTNAVYSVTGDAGSIFEWTVEGGIVTSGDSTSTISVDWDAAGTYSVSVVETNQFGCVGDTIRETIIVNPLPATISNNWDLTICPPDNKNIIYTVNGMDSSVYQWTVQNGTITSGQGADSVTIDWEDHGIGVISVLETTNKGCTNEFIIDTVRLDGLMLEMLVVSDNYDDDTKVEISWDTLYGDYFNPPFYLFKKAKNEAGWQLLDTVSIMQYLEEGVPTSQNIFQYKIAAINLCADTVQATEHNNILLQGEGDEDSKEIALNWNQYNNWENGVQAYEVWRKLDNETDYSFYYNAGTDTAVTFENGKDGFIHKYRILAKNFSGEYASWSNELELEFDHLIETPNAFTPNGDGKNDTWMINDIELYPDTKVQVFNRWGNLVYGSESYNNDWDGTRNGDPLPDATYYYILKLSNDKEFTGSVTIIR